MADVINPAYLSMPAQVQKNKDDIEALRNSAIMATPEGQYSAATTYGKGALVTYTDGNIYYHFSDIETRGVPPTDIATWVLYQEGIKGTPGTNGSNGYPIYLVTSNYGPTSPRAYKSSIKTPAGYPDPISGSIVYFQNGYIATLETDSGDYWTLNTSVVNLNGQTGAAGADGLPALTYGGVANFGTTPIPGTNITNLVNTSFNRTPKVGDRFLAFSVYTTNNYICGLRITSVGGTNSYATVETYSFLSDNNKKYYHALYVALTDANYGTAKMSLSIINNSPIALSNANVGAALRAYCGTTGFLPATGKIRDQSSPVKNGVIIGIQPTIASETSWDVYYFTMDDNDVGYKIFQSSVSWLIISDIVTPLS